MESQRYTSGLYIPTVTVLITTYNYGRFIEEAIDSVLAQDFPLEKIQIIVVDDGSTDDTPERVKKYGSRIEYFQKPNGGQASALNFGFAKARGEIIALLDADDLFLPSKLSLITRAFQQNPAVGMVYHPYEQWSVQTNERWGSNFPLISGDIHTVPDQFFLYYPHPTSCISFRRAVLNRLLPIPETIRMAADAYPVNLIPFISPIVALSDRLVIYRVHGKNSWPCFENVYHGNESQMPVETRKKRLQMWQIVVEAMRKWLAENGFTNKQLPARSFLYRWSLYLQNEQFKIEPPGRLRYFWYEFLHNHSQSPIQSWKLTTFNYLFAPMALVLGYGGAARFYELRGATMRHVEEILGTVPRAKPS